MQHLRLGLESYECAQVVRDHVAVLVPPAALASGTGELPILLTKGRLHAVEIEHQEEVAAPDAGLCQLDAADLAL